MNAPEPPSSPPDPAVDHAGIEAPGPFASPGRSVARNMAALMASQSVTWVLATIVAAVTPRFLGDTAVGQLRISTSVWAMAVVLATFGTTTLLTFDVARDTSIAQRLLGQVIRLRIALLVALCPFIALLVWAAGYDATTITVVAMTSVASTFVLMATAYVATMHGLQEMGSTARVEVVGKLVTAAATVAVLAAGLRIFAVASVTIAGTVLSYVLINRAFRAVQPAFQRSSPYRVRTLVLASVPFLLVEASLTIYQQVDVVVMSFLVDKEAIGWYATADILFGSLLFVPMIAMTAMFPAIVNLQASDPSAVPGLLQRSFDSLLLIAVPIGLATILVADSFVDVLYGPKFANTTAVLSVYGVVVILSCQTILIGRFALAIGQVKFWTALLVGAIVVSVPLDMVLVPWTDERYGNGAIGGALAYVVTESIMLTVGVARVAPHLVNRKTVARVLRCGFAGVAMMLAGWPLHSHFFLLPGAVGLAVYAIAIILTSTLNADERQHIAHLRSVVAGRFGR